MPQLALILEPKRFFNNFDAQELSLQSWKPSAMVWLSASGKQAKRMRRKAPSLTADDADKH
jgi:hypothetical protein